MIQSLILADVLSFLGIVVSCSYAVEPDSCSKFKALELWNFLLCFVICLIFFSSSMMRPVCMHITSDIDTTTKHTQFLQEDADGLRGISMARFSDSKKS